MSRFLNPQMDWANDSYWWTIPGKPANGVYIAAGAESFEDSLVDLSGSGNDLVAVNKPAWTSDDGWDFDGVANQLDCPIVASADTGDWSCFVKFTARPSGSTQMLGNDQEFNIGFIANDAYVQVNHNNLLNAAAGENTYAGVTGFSGPKIFWDGAAKSTITQGTMTVTKTIAIGTQRTTAFYGGSGVYFEGKVQAIVIYPYTLTDAEVASLTTLMAALPEDIFEEPGPTTPTLLPFINAYYSMEGAADVACANSSGDTLIASVSAPASVAGVVANARHCNSATPDDFTVTAPHSAGHLHNESWTVCAWINPQTLDNYQHIYTYHGGAPAHGLEWKATSNGKIATIYYNSEGSTTIHADLGGTGNWRLMAATFDHTTRKVTTYREFGNDIEPTEWATAPDGTISSANFGDLRVGVLQNAGPVAAYIDELVVFDKCLTSDELRWIYNSGAGRAYADF